MDQHALIIPIDIFSDPAFANEPKTEREAYIWLMARGSEKLRPRAVAREWQWAIRKVIDFIRKMRAVGLFIVDSEILSAVDIDSAVRHPDIIVGESWRSLRLRVFVRDGFTCQYCGGRGPLHCDHILPKSRGGLDVESNLTTACSGCNLSKGAKLVGDWSL